MNILLSIIIVVMLIIIITLIFKLKNAEEELDELYVERSSWLSNKNKISMLEMKARDYKEGKNIFTVMREIQDIISDDYKINISDLIELSLSRKEDDKND